MYGSVDFIFGEDLVMFQDCNIYARLWGTIMTAQSKSDAKDISAFSFQNCNVTASLESNKDDPGGTTLQSLSYNHLWIL